MMKGRLKTSWLILYRAETGSAKERRGCVQFFMRVSSPTEETKHTGLIDTVVEVSEKLPSPSVFFVCVSLSALAPVIWADAQRTSFNFPRPHNQPPLVLHEPDKVVHVFYLEVQYEIQQWTGALKHWRSIFPSRPLLQSPSSSESHMEAVVKVFTS